MRNHSSTLQTSELRQQEQAKQKADSLLLSLLKKCESASRPICFETIDVILRNKDADKMVLRLTGKPVDEAFRQMKVVQLEDYLFALEDLAQCWKLVDDAKYQHR